MSKIKVSSGLTTLKLYLVKYKSVYVVYDRNVADFAEKIASGRPSLAITADEEHKTMATVLDICGWLLAQKADRESLVLAVGGGVTTDMVGFAANIYKRGVRYANVPTTLLAMVDAAIGGKTGVNLDSYKNMLGVIRQPEFTYINPTVLSTLPERQLKSGAAEMLKTFIIKDNGNYEKALKVISAPFDAAAYEPLIAAAAKVKRGVVRRDEFERGPRRMLNLGHTYGHAVEWWQRKNGIEDPYTHGEAVAIGMVQAARMSEEKGYAREGLANKLKADFAFCGLPTEFPCPLSELEQAVKQDKKAEGSKINFVFIKNIGKVIIKKI